MATTVLLADLPPMLEDMVAGLLGGRAGIDVVRGEASGRDVIDAAVEAGAPVVVVARRNPSDLASIAPHLAKAANVSVVALASDGGSACLHAFRPTGQRFEDVSAEQIVDVITAAAAGWS